MPILLPTFGSAGDVYPLIRLAAKLNERGHRGIIITNPVHKNLIEKSAIGFIPLGTSQDYFNVISNPNLWHPTRGFRVIMENGILPAIEPLFKIIRDFSPKDTQILSAPFMFGAKLAHEVCPYPFGLHFLQPNLVRSRYAPPLQGSFNIPSWLPPSFNKMYYRFLDENFIDPVILPSINKIRSKLSLPPVKHILDEWLYSERLNLCLFPEWFAPSQPDWPANTICCGFPEGSTIEDPLPQDIVTFLEEGSPPLVFTLGTSMRFGQHFFSNAIDAAQMTGKRAILLANDQTQIPEDLPESIIKKSFLPLRTLLPRCSVLIHHGGIGTMAQAFAAGIPQLVVPLGQDQPDNGQRMKKLGCGEVLPIKDLNPGKLAQTILQLDGDSIFNFHANQISQKVNLNQSLEIACDVIIDKLC